MRLLLSVVMVFSTIAFSDPKPKHVVGASIISVPGSKVSRPAALGADCLNLAQVYNEMNQDLVNGALIQSDPVDIHFSNNASPSDAWVKEHGLLSALKLPTPVGMDKDANQDACKTFSIPVGDSRVEMKIEKFTPESLEMRLSDEAIKSYADELPAIVRGHLENSLRSLRITVKKNEGKQVTILTKMKTGDAKLGIFVVELTSVLAWGMKRPDAAPASAAWNTYKSRYRNVTETEE